MPRVRVRETAGHVRNRSPACNDGNLKAFNMHTYMHAYIHVDIDESV